jgi:putative Mn2+ efflux pump MntP
MPASTEEVKAGDELGQAVKVFCVKKFGETSGTVIAGALLGGLGALVIMSANKQKTKQKIENKEAVAATDDVVVKSSA